MTVEQLETSMPVAEWFGWLAHMSLDAQEQTANEK